LYGIACEPSGFIPIDENVKYAGIGCVLAGAGALAIELACARRNVRSQKRLCFAWLLATAPFGQVIVASLQQATLHARSPI
jgi:hypothetical protein